MYGHHYAPNNLKQKPETQSRTLSLPPNLSPLCFSNSIPTLWFYHCLIPGSCHFSPRLLQLSPNWSQAMQSTLQAASMWSLQNTCYHLTLLLKPLCGSLWLPSEQDRKFLIQHKVRSWLTLTLCASFITSPPPTPKSYHQPTAAPQIYYALAIYAFGPASSPARSTYLLSFLSAKSGLTFISAQTSPLPVIPESFHWHSSQNRPVVFLPKCSSKHLPDCAKDLAQWLVT